MINGTAVSVVIPTIGRASLRTAVDSALNQTSPPMEVIVVLDRDCDPDLPESDSIRVLRTPGRVGPSRAKQIGVESAKGNVIALLDDDDVWYPDKLEKNSWPRHRSAMNGSYRVDICTMLPGRKPVTCPHRLIRRDGPPTSSTCLGSVRYGEAALACRCQPLCFRGRLR